jgi:hypothetical protein|tara:strand:- start:3059 stop:3613 length:555 start_codon:yes stop_codon:yes gene_type:complete
MATTFVSIANRAITYLGGEVISDLADDTKEGRAVNRLYEQTRDALLRDHAWNFSIKRVQIAASTTSPVFEYTNAFTWPADCLRIIEADTSEEWAVEGRTIVTDASPPLDIVYVHQVTDPTLFDAKFVEAYALRIAADIAFDLTGSQAAATVAEQKFTQFMNEAKTVDGQESLSAVERTWLDARA